jgi:hypothetical protein
MSALKTIRESLPPDYEPGIDIRGEIEYAERSALPDLIAAYDSIFGLAPLDAGTGIS